MQTGMPPHHPQPITPAGHVEPVARRVRAEIDGKTVLDTTAAKYLWAKPFYPQFQIPLRDIDAEALTIADDVEALPHGTGSAVTLTTVATSSSTTTAPSPHGHLYVTAEHPALVDTVHLEWDALDAWYEEDEMVFVHPAVRMCGWTRCGPPVTSGSNVAACCSPTHTHR